MTDCNNEYKNLYATMIRAQYPSLPDDPLVIANWVFGGEVITEALLEIKKASLSYLVGYFGLLQHTKFSTLIANGMTRQEAFREVEEEFLKQYRDWMETPAFLSGRAKVERDREKWLRRQQRRTRT